MMEPDSDGRRDQRLSPPCPPPLSPLSGPAGLQTALLTQLTAQHASRLQYQQALLAWARLVSGGGGGLPLLADPAAPLAGRSSPSASSGSPPRSDGSPPARPARKQTARPKVFTCPICGRSFGYKHVLQNHVRTHTGEKPFQCTECHKRFTRDHHLKTHMRLHTGEKPYQCAHCARRFVQVANLRRHLRVHTGERPYACRLCSARFSDSNQLKSHELVHSDQKPLFGCSFCGSRFRRRYQLAVHRCAMMQDALTTVAEGEMRLFDRNSSQEMLRPLKPVDVLGAGTAARLTALVTEPGTEGVDEDLAVADGTLSPQTGLRPTPALVDGGQTEPEDLSVTASQWSCSAPEDRRHSPASLPSPAGDLRRTGEGTPRQGSPSSPTGHRRYGEESGGDAPRRKEDTGGQFVPWWVLRERHGSSSGLEESRGLSVTSQDLPPVAAWPLHLGQREQLQVYVYPEKQPPLVRVRGWDQLAPERTTADRSRAPPTADRGDSGGRWDAAEEGRPTADRRWPWSGPPPADARLCVPDEEWVGRPDGRRAVSPRDGALIGLGSSREGEERQGGGLPVPARYRAAGDGHRSQPADRVTSGRTRRALPPLVPLWIPQQSTAPWPPPEVGRGTVEEGNSGSALLQLLTAPSSPPPAAEHGHNQERASSDTTGHRNTGKERSHNEEQQERPHIEELQERPHTERLQEHHGLDSVSSDHSRETRGEKPLWESEDENYCRKDNHEIQA